MKSILLLLIPFFVLAQSVERKSASLPKISENYTILNSATGWTFTDESQWVSGENSLPYKDAKSNKYSLGSYSFGRDNFIKYELRKVNIDTNSYIILLHYRKSGRYRYPAIRRDYYTFREVVWYVFDESKLKEILPDDVKFNQAYFVDLDPKYTGVINDILDALSINSVERDIQKSINESFGIYRDKKISFAVFPVIYKGEKYVRFRFVDTQYYSLLKKRT